MHTRMKLLIAVACIVLVAGGGYYWWMKRQQEKEAGVKAIYDLCLKWVELERLHKADPNAKLEFPSKSGEMNEVSPATVKAAMQGCRANFAFPEP